MSYADSLMATDERIIFREKQHPLVFLWSARTAIIAMIVAVLFLILGNNLATDGAAGTFRIVLGWVAAALFIGGLLLLVWAVLQYLNHEYVVSNRRVLQIFGVLNKTSMDSSLEKINDATLSQSVFGRIFGFGDLDILTAADTGIDRFRTIRNPVAFKRAMLDAKNEHERDMAGTGRYAPSPPLRTGPPEPVAAEAPAAPAPPVAAAPVGDDTVSRVMAASAAKLSPDELTRTLASLADLRDRGAISPEEYEHKKDDLLSRL
jgi:PH (Pleckstrin Homology) domain-containing protein/putative oligomerization/nucleic acid binding protein